MRVTTAATSRILKPRFRITTTSRDMSSRPCFSSNYEPERAIADLNPLLKDNGGRWNLMQDGKGIERSFKFKTFKKTWEFMDVVAAECAVKKHHPEWSNVYNTTFIRWTTHSPPGLSEKDITMAKVCDEQARIAGEVESEITSNGRDLADIVAREGGDCCVPKKRDS